MPRAKLVYLEDESSPVPRSPSLHRDSSQQSHSLPDLINVERSAITLPHLSFLHDSEMIDLENDVHVVQPPITHSAAHPLPFISGSRRQFSIQSMLNPLAPAQD